MQGLPRRTDWQAPPSTYEVSDELVHVWRTGTNWPDGAIMVLHGWLSSDERQKSDCFHLAIDRTRYIIGRGLLRWLLGQWLRVSPDRLVFRSGAFCKPELAGGDDRLRPQFNISHSGEFVLIALAVGRAVGIDVEQLQPEIPAEAIAKRFFSTRECAGLAAADAPWRCEDFHACWTRKEAYIKARGEGLSQPLDQFDVSVDADAPARLLATRPDPNEARRWTLTDLDVGHAHRAALAVARAGWRLRAWEWPPGRTD
jgi:4'-phosphopantetheinyl transferase